MSADKQHLTNIDFDQDWQCCCRQTNDDVIHLSSLTMTDDTHQWSSITLPHIDSTSTQHDSNITNSYNWWYRKQFDWILSDQQVFLTFEDENNSPTSNINGIVWINGTLIFSGSLLSHGIPLELTEKLLYDEETTEKNNHSNTLVVCCANKSLSLHTRLIIHEKIICASGHVKLDYQTIEDNNDINYTVCVNDADGRIGVTFKNPKRTSKSSVPIELPTITKRSSEPVIDEKQTKENKENSENISVPRLAIVILIVGTRGDVQPFIALGQSLLAAGHRVRLATHEAFRSFVRGNGLEFFPLAGDPADLISFMVKNAGIIPSVSSIVAGDVTKKRRTLADILASTWLACIANDDETLIPFTAEAIIANPPSFGHIHCAEKLEIPLHIMFTMPWSPTIAFSHPLCKIDSSKGPTEKLNFYSYHVVEMLTWSGMHHIVNHFRKKILGLSAWHAHQATNVLIDECVPHTYCWSSSLAPKPSDWGAHIDVSGFFFLDLGTAYTNPPQDLLDFLGINNDHHDSHKLSAPIYIGFGSIAGHDSRRLLGVVVDALGQTGYRALLAGLAIDTDQLPENIFKIGNVPHDWLFQHVSAVCHHGGAGTTAAGLRAGKPTIIVPFFGDQFFWGNIIEKSGAGPRPLPGKSITAAELAEAFQFAHQETTRVAAEHIRASMANENGCEAAVRAFHNNLPVARMRSDLESTYAACYCINELNIQISRPVAHVLVAAGVLDVTQLHSNPTRDWQLNHDRHNHLLTHSVSEHTGKSSSSIFAGTNVSLRRAFSSSSNNLTMSANNSFDQEIDHPTRDSLSSYGQRTDVLDRVPPVYDPYSDSTTHDQSHIIKSKSSRKATGLSLWHSRKSDLIGFVKRSCTRSQHHGLSTGTAGALIATTNCAIEPAVGTLPATTWLGGATYASVEKAVVTYTKEEDGISPAAKIASVVSGFDPKVCQQILVEFEKIKMEQKHSMVSSSPSKKHSKAKFQFRRQRSHSTSAIN